MAPSIQNCHVFGEFGPAPFTTWRIEVGVTLFSILRLVGKAIDMLICLVVLVVGSIMTVMEALISFLETQYSRFLPINSCHLANAVLPAGCRFLGECGRNWQLYYVHNYLDREILSTLG